MKKGLFLTFEGIDGAGKSTQIAFLKRYLEENGYQVIVTREPGGTEIGNSIRDVLLDKNNTAMSPMAELLLYYADRAQHINETILPSLKKGICVISDRYYDSSFAYQLAGRKIDDKLLNILNENVVKDVEPDMTFFLDIPTNLSEERIRQRGDEMDRLELEGLKFKDSVRNGFLAQAEKYPERIRVINALQTRDEIFAEITANVSTLFEK